MDNVKNRAEMLNALKTTLHAYLNIGIEEMEFEKHHSKKDLLLTINNKVLKCNKCPLYKSKKNYVFGEGSPDAALMFVGEAPGYYEDVEGKPFVGKAGQLLTKIIKAMGFERNDVYISNILKCRPPENRDPKKEEIEACFPYLTRQIEIIKPKVICALGRFAAQTLVSSDISISNLRGRLLFYRGIKVIPTYHPSFLLRNPHYKRATWEDMQLILKILGRGDNKNG